MRALYRPPWVRVKPQTNLCRRRRMNAQLSIQDLLLLPKMPSYDELRFSWQVPGMPYHCMCAVDEKWVDSLVICGR
jgi:hypothetical protein